MADRGLIACYSQPVAKEGLTTLNYEPQAATVSNVQSPTADVANFSYPVFNVVPTVRATTTTAAQTPKPEHAASAQYLYTPVNRGTPSNSGTLGSSTSTGQRVTQYWG